MKLFKRKPKQISVQGSEFDDRYLIPFRNYAFANTFSVGNSSVHFGDSNDSSDNEGKKENRIVATPKSVLNELEKIPNILSLDGLDDKIKILQEKSDLISQKYAKREIESLIFCLNNRKKYNSPSKKSKMLFRDFFGRFDVTTDEKIDILLKKYALVMKSADIFIPEFPTEAIQIMKEYSEKVEELCEKKATYLVIATIESFKQADKKRDPILLAQSPFGFYYYILGAWDKEMILLSEL